MGCGGCPSLLAAECLSELLEVVALVWLSRHDGPVALDEQGAPEVVVLAHGVLLLGDGDVDVVVVPAGGFGGVDEAAGAVVDAPAFGGVGDGPDAALPDEVLDVERFGVVLEPARELPAALVGASGVADRLRGAAAARNLSGLDADAYVEAGLLRAGIDAASQGLRAQRLHSPPRGGDDLAAEVEWLTAVTRHFRRHERDFKTDRSSVPEVAS